MTQTTPVDSYDDHQWRLLQYFANSECDDMDVEAMAWGVREIERLRETIRAMSQQAAGGAPAGYYWKLTREDDARD